MYYAIFWTTNTNYFFLVDRIMKDFHRTTSTVVVVHKNPGKWKIDPFILTCVQHDDFTTTTATRPSIPRRGVHHCHRIIATTRLARTAPAAASTPGSAPIVNPILSHHSAAAVNGADIAGW
mmetsp:Transcript_27851/g.41103  ORF Transcript_27851/g.41103 Transcript_27851/m.41103 type:complete len:121 (-) Transcript_27851:1363-1725(-)